MSCVEKFLTLFANCTFANKHILSFYHFISPYTHTQRERKRETEREREHTIYLIVTNSEKGFERTNKTTTTTKNTTKENKKKKKKKKSKRKRKSLSNERNRIE